ncbi:MAG: hypothetical protein ACPGQL_07265 [Thermoplasmatota archaeon]
MHRFALAPGLVCLLLLAAPVPASTSTETVETPAGTFYLFYNDELTVRDRAVCVPSCTAVPFPDRTPYAHVYQETNGCPGLQRVAGTCAGTGVAVDADDRLVP